MCGLNLSSQLVQPAKEHQRNETRVCLACSDNAKDLKEAMHPTGSCAVWRSLSLEEKKEKVNCEKCPFYGKDTKHTTAECKKVKFKCHDCLQDSDHHTWFCTYPKS